MHKPDPRLLRNLAAAVILCIATSAGFARGVDTGRMDFALAPEVVINDLVAMPPAARVERAPSEAEVLETYAEIALAGYQDALNMAQDMDAAIEALIADPNVVTLNAARIGWKLSSIAYRQTEVFRFGNPLVDEWEARVDAASLDEGLIDYVDARYGAQDGDNALSRLNIVANPTIAVNGVELDASAITPALLRDQLQTAAGVQANAATGYPAIEFLLWGQDLNDTGPGAGMRPFTDYSTAPHADRRAAYLKAVSSLLVSDLEEMVANWQEGGAARAALPELGLSAIFTGMGSLGNGVLAGDRMMLGLTLHDPDTVLDRFSDYAHTSYLMNGVGIRNVYLGRYLRMDGSLVEGPSLSAFVASKDRQLDTEVKALIATAVSKLTAIGTRVQRAESYDQQIAEGSVAGNRVVQAAIDALIAQTRGIERAVALLGLSDAVTIRGSDALNGTDAVIQ